MSDEARNTDAPQRPVETVREGRLKASIWRNEAESGAYHSISLARTYSDKDGQLRDTQSFRAKDMLPLSELARRAHHQAHELDREAFKAERREEKTPDRKPDRGR